MREPTNITAFTIRKKELLQVQRVEEVSIESRKKFMAESYAARLKKGVSYGACGLPETFDTSRVFQEKAAKLVEFIRNSKQFVVHTGAGNLSFFGYFIIILAQWHCTLCSNKYLQVYLPHQGSPISEVNFFISLCFNT